LLLAALEQMLGHGYCRTWQVGDTRLPLSIGGEFEEFISLIHDTGKSR
jgi:hypothetical protein